MVQHTDEPPRDSPPPKDSPRGVERQSRLFDRPGKAQEAQAAARGSSAQPVTAAQRASNRLVGLAPPRSIAKPQDSAGNAARHRGRIGESPPPPVSRPDGVPLRQGPPNGGYPSRDRDGRHTARDRSPVVAGPDCSSSSGLPVEAKASTEATVRKISVPPVKGMDETIHNRSTQTSSPPLSARGATQTSSQASSPPLSARGARTGTYSATESSIAKQRLSAQRQAPASQLSPAVIWQPSTSQPRATPRPVTGTVAPSNSAPSISIPGSRPSAIASRLGTPPPQRSRLLGLSANKGRSNDRSVGNISSTSIGTVSSQFDEGLEQTFQLRMGGLKEEIDQLQSEVKDREGALAKMKADIVVQERRATPQRRRQDAFR